ncbi:alanyl-tRNA editing protein [Heyndrickxia acidicola]|uniref:DHHA1 domain-containing protein n=1 Tax=Heyndrickxia acidicola TaxID=209389 RepID=A0ABU6MAA0_9BACI|nr:alanyl-tRNA editing protein [Heyndrickxia acidicola]MED1201589.1 DHHA1 domain-containing protein [Heyndrickxia acidicola]
MTEKLYYTSPDISEWRTDITKIIEQDSTILVTLKETAFYPEGGGQPWDLGTIDGIDVLEVFEADEEVFHKIAKKPLQTSVKCQIDSFRRLEHTQHHTGQHLLSAVCSELYDVETASFHLGSEYCSIDLTVPFLHEEQLNRIEQRVNYLIYQDNKVKTYFVDKEKLHAIPLKKWPKAESNIRIVEIQGIDFSACCGTHVKSIGGIGLIKLLKTEKHKGNIRLYFTCGRRALADYKEKHDTLTKLSAALSTSYSEVESRVARLEKEKKDLQKQLEEIEVLNARFHAKQLLENSPETLVAFVFQDKNYKECERIAKEAAAITNQVILAATEIEKRIILTHKGNSPFDCGGFFKEHLKKYYGKGGGNGLSAQAAFPSLENMQNFIQFTVGQLN